MKLLYQIASFSFFCDHFKSRIYLQLHLVVAKRQFACILNSIVAESSYETNNNSQPWLNSLNHNGIITMPFAIYIALHFFMSCTTKGWYSWPSKIFCYCYQLFLSNVVCEASLRLCVKQTDHILFFFFVLVKTTFLY